MSRLIVSVSARRSLVATLCLSAAVLILGSEMPAAQAGSVYDNGAVNTSYNAYSTSVKRKASTTIQNNIYYAYYFAWYARYYNSRTYWSYAEYYSWLAQRDAKTKMDQDYRSGFWLTTPNSEYVYNDCYTAWAYCWYAYAYFR